MDQHLYIVTGASRGLGLALAEQLLQPAHQLLCLSRRTSDALQQSADTRTVALTQWAQDLAQPDVAAARLQAWLAALDGSRLASATLINNAALLPPPGPVDGCAPALLSAALRVGLEAPVMLSAAFLHATRDWRASRRLLNISSGLGRRAMAGSSAYCAVKAGLDHFSRALALDEALRPNGARVVSLAPGVIDTEMQAQLRGASAALFPEQSRFAQLKTSGALQTPADTATRVLAYLARPDFGAHPVADIRDA